MIYIPRTLVASKGNKDERPIEEACIPALGRVVVLLGEPGIGKTELTKQLSNSLGATRVPAGTFCRAADPTIYTTNGAPLIIDGLDEIAASSLEPPIDRVLQSLNNLKNPNVIISCRAADWTGATNRAKFVDDYGVSPVPVHILPFNRQQATSFLQALDERIECDELLSAIDAQGLEDLVGNPLTLKLLAEVWLEGAGLPQTKTELLKRATKLLTKEDNERHDQSTHARVSPDALLEAAGGVFAHLLLAGAVGIKTNNRRSTTEGFVLLAEMEEIATTVRVATVIKTRLFKSDGEDLQVPVHRVVAEYLAAHWLSQKLDQKLSERRLFQFLQFNGGVPSALRGLHAWLGYFSPQVRERCIDADPYGFLRYGDTSALSAQSARYLLEALARLADEDPYFRSEDWSVRSVAGLARPELKSDIIALLTSPQRHVHLSALILESLAGSSMTDQVVPELLALAQDATAVFVERSEAAEALAEARILVNWKELIEKLLAQKKHDSWRLAVETIASVGPMQFDAKTIADALIALNGLNESARREARVAGVDYRLIKRTPRELAKSILDEIAARIAAKPKPYGWRPGRSMTSVIERLLVLAIESPAIEPNRFWSWVRHLESRFSDQKEKLDGVRDYLLANPNFRREVQRIVLYDETIVGGPWMAIIHELPRAVPGLNVSDEDAAFFIEEIGRATDPTPLQIRLWGDLVRATWRAHLDEILQVPINVGTGRHPRLAALYEEIAQPPTRDFEAEERKRRKQYESKRLSKFRRHRDEFSKDLPQIRSGHHRAALVALAKGYLGHYANLDNKACPYARLIEWVGEEVADCAIKGFVAALAHDDLPDLEKICAIREKGEIWTVEPLMVAGVAELVRTGRSLDFVRQSVVRAVLGIWWNRREFHSTKLGEDIKAALEQFVFGDKQGTESFIATIIEPQLVSGGPHVSGLYQFVRDKRFFAFSPKLALNWLRDFQNASFDTQLQLLRLLIARGDKGELLKLVAERISNLDALDYDCQRLWTAAAFCLAPKVLQSKFQNGSQTPKELIWAIKSIVLPDRTEGEGLHLPVDRYEAIVEVFAPQWPMVGRPSGGWVGDQNPWDASQFVSYCISAIGADRTVAGTESLEHLSKKLASTGYLNKVKHVAQELRRNRRDQEYSVPTIGAVKRVLANAEPTTVDDLKALLLDHLSDLQKYVRDADTGEWETFWANGRPKIENLCRDRLLGLLRPRIGGGVELFLELPMPDQNRVDIYATILGQGLPMEIKGQWHAEVWNASKTQLDDKYARDWRTGGRGIYLVFWFGDVAGKKLPARSDGSAAPANPSELRQMLMDGLSEAEQSRIDVVVFDVSIPPKIEERQEKAQARQTNRTKSKAAKAA